MFEGEKKYIKKSQTLSSFSAYSTNNTSLLAYRCLLSSMKVSGTLQFSSPFLTYQVQYVLPKFGKLEWSITWYGNVSTTITNKCYKMGKLVMVLLKFIMNTQHYYSILYFCGWQVTTKSTKIQTSQNLYPYGILQE